MPGSLFLFLVLMRVPAVRADDGAVDQNTSYGDHENGHTHVDLDTTFTNSQRQKRSISTFEMAFRNIYNKARRVIEVKDSRPTTYLLVYGYRVDALKDFQSLKTNQIGKDVDLDGPLVGKTGNKIVRLSAAKGRSAPVLEIKTDSPVDTKVTSVIYVPRHLKHRMETLYNSIQENKYLPGN